MPMDWAANMLKCGDRNACRASSAEFNEIERDMHNLYPTLAEVNKMRASMPFAEISGETPAVDGCDLRSIESGAWSNQRRKRADGLPAPCYTWSRHTGSGFSTDNDACWKTGIEPTLPRTPKSGAMQRSPGSKERKTHLSRGGSDAHA